MTDFFRHAFVMFSGSVVAQAIPLLVMPVLTRLYSPSDFGVYSSLVALAGIISIISCLRFDLAIVLPKEKRDAANLVALSVFAALAINAIIVLLLLLWLDPLSHVFPMLKTLGAWSYIVPFLALLIALQQILSFFANREKLYRLIAISNIALQIAAAIIAISIGYFSVSNQVDGLPFARVTGVMIAVVFLCGMQRPVWAEYRPLVSRAGMQEALVRYRQFPLFNVPYSLTGVFSREFIVLALTSFGLLQVAGHYGLARTILNAPINFMTAALSQVFYREAAENLHTPAFRSMTLKLMFVLAAGLAPLFAVGFLWSEEIFTIMFGAGWREAGRFAALLMPLAMLSLFTSWPERIFEVCLKQKLALFIQLTFDSISIATVVWMLRINKPALLVVSVYVAVQLVYQLVYLYYVFQLAELGMKKYVTLLTLIAVCFFSIILIHYVDTKLFVSLLVRFSAESACAVIIALSGFTILRKHVYVESESR